MTLPVRRTVGELCTLYSLEPEMREVIVEGWDDVGVVGGFLKTHSLDRVCVFEIGVIEISAREVLEEGFEVGNKGRLLALANVLDRVLVGPSRSCPTLIYDADSDRLEGTPVTNEFLLVSDYSCMEMYFFDFDTFKRFAEDDLQIPDFPASDFLASLENVLIPLWLAKVANHSLELGMSWMDFFGCCSFNRVFIDFNESDFIHRYLSKNSLLACEDEFRRELGRLRALLGNEPRHHINGHHFLLLARKVLRRIAISAQSCSTEKQFRASLHARLNPKVLGQHRMFQDLLSRVAA